MTPLPVPDFYNFQDPKVKEWAEALVRALDARERERTQNQPQPEPTP